MTDTPDTSGRAGDAVAAAEVPALPVTFRPTRTRVVLLTVGVAVFVVLTAVSLMLRMGGGERASFIVTAALFLAVLVLLSRPRVTVEADGVTVVNLTTRRRLVWAQILAVRLRPGDPWVSLDLSDGTSLPAMGIQPGIAKRQALAQARALRALVDQGGPREGAPDGTADSPGR
ncbi:PH domain-containing protein [Streptomyces albus subsp. chlorinus]|uniref:PH domain-containing protein n=1 Tax=Streptomyces albus TaxID=1888 RepID=UPI00156F7A19|nr:PH domain-containing protein [Streptomyces albus]NSC20546.1 PH domain-containing protein [Streptomyces albus subsp. chlorinus]